MRRMIMLMFVLSIIGITIFSGCIQQGAKTIAEEKTSGNITDIITSGSTQELKKFSSALELRQYLKASAVDSGALNIYGMGRSFGVAESAKPMIADSVAPSGAVQKTVEGSQASSGDVATDYSKTNIQVEGVDEADFVKNDGKYIYVIAQDKLVIVDAFPASQAKILSTTLIEGSPRDLFINGDRLLIFTENTERVYSVPEYDYMPRPIETMKTDVLVYDISDRNKPDRIANFSISGNYFQSRMIADYV